MLLSLPFYIINFSLPTSRFSFSCSSSSSSEENYKPIQTKNSKVKGKLSDRLGPNKNKLANNKQLKKQKNKPNKQSPFYSEFGLSMEIEENSAVLQQRAARFNTTKQSATAADTSSSIKRKKDYNFIIDSGRFGEDSPSGTADFDWADFHIVGTCQDLEKSFLRLTKAPEPCDVRPVPVLKLSLQNVKDKWLEKQDYYYACDQLKSIRQDLTVSERGNWEICTTLLFLNPLLLFFAM